MSHADHLHLPGAHPGMLLFDGCRECERRATDPLTAILHLDEDRQLLAWRLMRAVKWSTGDGIDRPISQCERALIGAMYSIGVWLERGGISPDEVERKFETRMLELRLATGYSEVMGTRTDDVQRLLTLRVGDGVAMIDRAAAALADSHQVDWDLLPETTQRAGSHSRTSLRAQARAVIGAIHR